MKYLISGGGTGGHIYPALAIAREIKSRDKDAEILYIGTEKGLEAELVPKEGLEFKTIRVNHMPRKINLNSLIALKELFIGLNQSRKIIKDFKPDIVIGTGGFVSGPILYMATRKKIPTFIHEQNALPGITNKILSRYVDRIAVTFKESTKYFKHPERVVFTGNPIRKEILNIDKKEAYKDLDIAENLPVVLSFGGSGGQKSLNDAILYILKNNKFNDKIQLIHITGNRLYEDFVSDLKKNNIDLNKNIKILPYLYNMPQALNIADIVISSSGAITMAEIAAIGVASILIPKAYTAENHQEFNARSYENEEASLVILEKDLEGEILYKNIIGLLEDEELLMKMGRNSKRLANMNATNDIVKNIERLLRR